MPRWEPDAPGRLLHAALELSAEQGYERTTAAQIAERAGLTKATLFRLFTDKREVLFQGQPASVATVAESVAAAPEGCSGVQLLERALVSLCEGHSSTHQDIGRQIDVLVRSSPELHERSLFKRAMINAALAGALEERTRDPRLSGVLADLGMRAYYDGFDLWIGRRGEEGLGDIVMDELNQLLQVLPGIRPVEE